MPRQKKSKYYIRPDGLHETIRIIEGKRKAFRGHSDAEVDRKILEFKGIVERGRPFKEVAEEWQEAHFITLSPNSLRNYSPAFMRTVEHFKDTPMKQISPSDVNRFISAFAASRAQKTVQTQKLVLSLIFSHAVLSGDVDYNPCQNIRIPKNLPKSRREAPSAEQIEIVKKSVSDEFGFLPYFLLYSGLRIGEALALTWGDVDTKKNVIHVSKSVCYVNNKPTIKKPKTEAGTREVILLDVLKKKLPKRGQRDSVIFHDGSGGIITETDFRRKWWQYQKRTGITASPHQLRHAYATILFEAGISVKDAQDLLGHSTVAMTQDIYTHISQSRKKQTATILNAALNTQNTQDTSQTIDNKGK